MGDREPVSLTELPSNSRFKAKSSLEPEEKTERKKPKINKVISGTVEKKKSLGGLLKAIFFAEDITDVKDYVLTEVIYPSIRQGMADVFTRTANMLFLGEDGDYRSGRGGKDDYKSYSGYYERKNGRRSEVKTVKPSRLIPEDIKFRTRLDAERALDALIDLTEEYDLASVMDFFQLVGEIGEVVDDKFGWYKGDLRSAKVRPKNGGFYIDLPRPVSLEH